MGKRPKSLSLNMQSVKLTVLLVFLFTICHVNGGESNSDESFEHINLRNGQGGCAFQNKQLKYAKTEVANDEAFREYLISKGVTVGTEEPAFLFFNLLPLADVFLKMYHDSSKVFELSKSVAKELFNDKLPRSKNINPLLRKSTSCFEEYFDKLRVGNKDYKCPKNPKYRSIEGFCTCSHSKREGAAGTQFTSLLYQNYDDSISKFRKEKRTRQRLPMPRKLSTIFFDRCQNNDSFLDNGPSIGGIQLGVFLTQDIVSLAYPRSSPSLSCCKKDYSTILPNKLLHKSCDPIRIPKGDRFFAPRGITCMNFLRTQASYDNDYVLSSREQMNLVTSFVDLSVIYGNAKEHADAVRSFQNGLLQTNADNKFREDADGNFIFFDLRSSASPVVLLFNVLFIREHNRIACTLKDKFPNWNDEKLFQEARRWNIAQYQHIIFEWIQMFIPQEYRHLRIIKSKKSKISCATSNEFGHSIFRQHHQFIAETVQLFDKNGALIQEVPLSDANPVTYIKNSYASVARALIYQKQNYNGCHNQIRNQLFKNTAGVGIDVFSFDIKRGRDHGIQPYYKYVKLCLDKTVKSFSDLKFLISDDDIKELRKVYDSVYDVDLYVGAHLEKKPKKFQFGPVGSCITNEQFHGYRHGDSFFYDNPKHPSPFTKDQLTEIRKASFSRILCNNADITRVTKNAFFAQNSWNPIIDCKSVPIVKTVY